MNETALAHGIQPHRDVNLSIIISQLSGVKCVLKLQAAFQPADYNVMGYANTLLAGELLTASNDSDISLGIFI